MRSIVKFPDIIKKIYIIYIEDIEEKFLNYWQNLLISNIYYTFNIIYHHKYIHVNIIIRYVSKYNVTITIWDSETVYV